MTSDEYKQWLIQKILSGTYDYTYGPGSPGATPSDMSQRIGSTNNVLRTGDLALPHDDYKMFSPDERTQYGIADTSWIKPGVPTPRGSVERYFGSEPAPAPAPAPTPGSLDTYNQMAANAATVPQPAGMTDLVAPAPFNYDKFNNMASASDAAGSLGGILGSLGKSMMQGSQQGSSQAMAMLQQDPNPLAALLAQLTNNPTMYLHPITL